MLIIHNQYINTRTHVLKQKLYIYYLPSFFGIRYTILQLPI